MATNENTLVELPAKEDDGQIIEPVGFDFGVTRRTFVQVLGAGLLIAATARPLMGQESRPTTRGRGGGGRQARPVPLDARIHLGEDGSITVMTGKVEGGQGSRTELTQAAAEELGVPIEHVQLLMADTAMVPDDGLTAGSGTTPRTMPAVRKACAVAAQLLADFKAAHGDKEVMYADLAKLGSPEALKQMVPADVTITRAEDWKVLGVPTRRTNGRDIVTGAHHYPYDITRPDMLYGKILRPPSYKATLKEINLDAAKAMEGVIVVRDGDFVGVAAPSSYRAKKAIAALQETANWDAGPDQPASSKLFAYLRENAKGGLPANPFADEVSSAAKVVNASYNVAYAQHAPMEPRSAVAEWADGKLTVWTSTQNPFGVRRELVNAFHLSEDQVRVIVPDFGGGFGGKHTGECAVEAARLAQSAKKPVALRWIRPEEFTWAYFRPAAAIDVQATLDAAGSMTSWHFVNVNSGNPGVQTPYRGKNACKYVESAPPLRHGSYRALASTANNFARESFIDELAHAAGKDPLEFRLAHLEDGRLKAVLEEAAKQFNWKDRVAKKDESIGVGLACGEEKGSFVAACAEVAIDRAKGTIAVRHVCQAFECGAIANPQNLKSQVMGAIVQGLGPALREAMAFDNGKITNGTFWSYEVPRFADIPTLDIHLLDRRDLPSAGAGETPIIAIAPAIGNAVFHATGVRLREMPMKLPKMARA